MVNDLRGDEETAAMRAFNRFYTRLIGLLDEGHLQSPYSLSEVRVLFELAQQPLIEASELRVRLGIDAGYLSRICSRFFDEGLLQRDRLDVDRRRQVIGLTPRGRDRFAELDQAASAAITTLLAPLDEPRRHELVQAMGSIQRLLDSKPDAQTAPATALRAPTSGDFGWVVERHGALYRDEYDWDESFESLVARIVADFLDTFDPDYESAWIAELDARRAGCVFCVREDHDVAKLRLLLVEPWARGLGLGARLIEACIDFARSRGYKTLLLWTNDVLVDARRLYDRFGFELVDRQENRLFGHELVSETLSLGL